jgi:outer membrane protein assembly factor BamB
MGIGALWIACGGSGKTGGDGGADSANAESGPPNPDAGILDSAVADMGASVLEHHLHPTRDGAYVDKNVTKAAAAAVHIDSGFTAKVTGNIYGQPLYVDGWKKGQDAVFIATDQNHVTALNATTGAVLWDVTLGPPVPLKGPTTAKSLPCGGPYGSYGVNSTPIIDLPSRTLYTESFQTPDGGTTKKHYVCALSIDDGTTKPGWPVDVAAAVSGFDPGVQQDRGALAILNGNVYVPYAGLNGDCGAYNGWVIGISTSHPTQVGSYSTTAPQGGIWGALSTDGRSLFATTGNTARGTTTWSGGEALIRFTEGPKFSGSTSDYFTPSNWTTLDTNDADLGSSASILFDLPGATPAHLAASMGKFGVVHLLDRDNLGGVGTGDGITGEGIFSLAATSGQTTGNPGQIKGTAASYTSAKGRYVVLHTESTIAVCPSGQSGDLLALRVTATSPPKLVPVWCAASMGGGSPIATTTDGTSNALVWDVSGTVGGDAQGSSRLFAFDGDTGEVVFAGGGGPEQLGTVYHWTSAIVAKGRFIVGGAGAVYAFTAL